MSAFSPFSKTARLESSIFLPITPMASIFTVILVILLKSYSPGVSSITPSENVTLPEVTSGVPVPDGLKIEVSSAAIVVGEKRVLRLRDFAVLEEGTTAQLFQPVLDALKRERAKVKTDSARAVVLADENAPYELVRKVLAASLQSGFGDVRVLVATENE